MLAEYTRSPGGARRGKGPRIGGHVFKIDEQHAIYRGGEAWNLPNVSDGTRLRESVCYLLTTRTGPQISRGIGHTTLAELAVLY